MMLKLLSKLPLFVLYGLSDFLYLVGNYVVRYRRDVVYSNLRNSFPEKGEGEIRRIANEFYHHLTDFIVEVVKALDMDEEELARRMRFTNPELLDEYIESRQSIILVTTHQGNLEWLLLASCGRFPFTVCPIYKPLRNLRVNELMLRSRARFGGEPISAHNLIMSIAKRRNSFDAIAIVADQQPGDVEERYWTRFLNQETPFFMGVDKLAKITKRPVIFVGVRRLKRGYYEATLEPIGKPPYDRRDLSMIERYANRTEALIREDPGAWLWSHQRWKSKRPLYD